MGTDEIHEATASDHLALEAATRQPANAQQTLLFARAEGPDERGARRELREQRRRHVGAAGRHDDRVEGRVLRTPFAAVAQIDQDVRDAERVERGARAAASLGRRSTEITRAASRARIAAW